MVGNKDEVLKAIRKLTNANGYDFFNNGGPYPPREHEKALYLSVQPREGDDRALLNFVVTIGSNRFKITFPGTDVPEYCTDLNQMLDIIKDWLLIKGKD
ncbi:MAG: hypothetical protein A2173_06100 [Planctomycetes bacterium RBG_13_44_8b]|nr:MAG: hypothetical protein A2173_06100 [Planctomycetes bacterium RBG_13_44_8b]